MAEKISKIILKVDLECCHCSKKIKKILCNYQDRWNIKSIIYDEKNNTVTITGPFDPKKLVKKLCCKACKVIKDIQIVEDKPPPPPPPQEPKPAPPPEPAPEPAPPEPAPVPPEPEPVPPAPPVEVPAPPSPDPEPEPTKVEANPPPPEPEVAPEPEAKAPEPVVCEPVQPAEPACPPGWPHGNGPPCCCWYHGTCRCCTCGRGCGPYGGYGLLPVAVVAAPTVVYGGGPRYDGHKTCELICEEDNSCMIM